MSFLVKRNQGDGCLIVDNKYVIRYLERAEEIHYHLEYLTLKGLEVEKPLFSGDRFLVTEYFEHSSLGTKDLEQKINRKVIEINYEDNKYFKSVREIVSEKLSPITLYDERVQEIINYKEWESFRSILYHSDIVPENILVRGDSYSIIDWEFVEWLPDFVVEYIAGRGERESHLSSLSELILLTSYQLNPERKREVAMENITKAVKEINNLRERCHRCKQYTCICK